MKKIKTNSLQFFQFKISRKVFSPGVQVFLDLIELFQFYYVLSVAPIYFLREVKSNLCSI